jgi:putative transposase
MSRFVVPGFPHHLTQRGSRRQQTFFNDGDYRHFRSLLVKGKRKFDVRILAWCLMPNHVHLVVVPAHESSLSRFCADVHRRYAARINTRKGWRGHLWQERFHSFVMDEAHLLAAVRYVELNPVRAGLCHHASQWPWSSVHAHLAGRSDDVTSAEPMLERIPDWAQYLRGANAAPIEQRLRQHARSGRPAGDEAFIARLQNLTGCNLTRRKPGRKSRRSSGNSMPEAPTK